MSGCSPWNENEDVRAATCSSLIRESELSSSSVSPSEKYSCSLSPLMFTNGSTAMECGGGLKAAAPGSAVVRDAVSPAGVLGCLETQNLSAIRYASAAQTTMPTATVIPSAGFALRGSRTTAGAAGRTMGPSAAG